MNPRVMASTFALLLLLCCVVSMSMAAVLNITTDQFSLLALKHHITHDPNDIIAKNWSSNAPVCSWIGVTCGPSHLRVTALNLSYMNLVGTIPPHVGNLSFLGYLNLKSNWFHGSVPNEMAQLRRMKLLNLGFNNFTGEIPSCFVLLPKLEKLDLYYNSFTGTIPPSLFNITSLQKLNIGGNKLWGFLPSNIFMAPALQFVFLYDNRISGSIPSNIFNNSSLRIIVLNYNSLSGELPENIFNQLPQLEGLYLFQNQLSGKLPLSLFSCKKLQKLNLARNNFTGRIPSAIGNLTMIRGIALSDNNFFPGKIPHEIGNLHYLEELYLSNCNFRDNIPAEIFNISTIRKIDLTMNYLWGSLPVSLGFTLPNLEALYLGINYISGKIPNSLSNSTMLFNLELGKNAFSGYIPNIFGNLVKLRWIDLTTNNLTNEPSNPELSVINSLANCKVLKGLQLSYLPLNSKLPITIGNLSNSLEKLLLGGSNLWGSIPTSIGNLSGLIYFSIDQNQFNGIIPIEIGRLKELQEFAVSYNKLEGIFPPELCKLKNIGYIFLSSNKFSGPIPSSVGNLTSLRNLWLDSNSFNSTIPSSLWSLSDLLELELSSNELRGLLPLDIGNLNALTHLNLSKNQLSGNIPSTIGKLQNLANLSLAQNEFEGSISLSFGNMVSLELLDLSRNNLSGVIPNSLEALMYLKIFNVSFNKLEGEVPSNGPFENFSTQSFMGNVRLCGGAPHLKLPKCKAIVASKPSKINAIVLKCVLPIIIVVVLLLTLTYVLIKRQKQITQSISNTNAPMATWRRISYYELQHVTDGFSDINLLGIGSFGKVYKGILSDGMNIAVKVFNLELEEAFKSFDVECEILCNIRHQNLVKIITSCANLDFKALVFNYMPNGNLEKWLHSGDHCLNIIQRLNIMIDVASGLDYLHYGCSTPIVHCDLKPSNVLLDEDMVGHLTDFGIGKLLNEGDSIRQTMTLATMGYMAPEYGLEGFVSKQCDVYSYGILLMETFTQKSPINDMFQEEFNMKHWVEESYPNAIIDIVDVKLLAEDGMQFSRKRDCLSSIMGLALECSAELPNERKKITDVLTILQKIKKRLINEVRVSRLAI